jgi:PAS domain S-box-containing protein
LRAVRSGSHDTRQGAGTGEAASHPSIRDILTNGGAALPQDEQKYRALFLAIDECFALCELVRGADGHAVSWRYLEINPAFEAESGLPRTQLEGKLQTEIGVDSDDQLVALYERVVDHNETVSFQYLSTSSRRYEVTAFSCGGELFGILSTRVGASRRFDETTPGSGTRQAFLLGLSDALRLLLEPTAIQDVASRMLAEHLGVTRAYYAEVDEEAGTVTIHRDFVRAGAPSMRGVYPMSEMPPIVVDILRRGQPFVTGDWLAEADPGPVPRARIAAFNMRAHLVVPLAKGGKLLGTLSVGDSAPREWTRYDLAIVEETAERTWAAVERANVEATLKTRETQLAFLDEISQLMAVAEPEGQILNRISERIATQLGLTHCTFLDVDIARGLVTTTFGWKVNQPVRGMSHTYRMADYLTPDYERAGRAGETVVVNNTETDPRTDAPAYARLGILAFVTVPFHREGEWKFMLAVGDKYPREWRTADVQLLRQLSERIFPRIERARAEAALRESEALYHSLFEMMDEGFAVGEIIRGARGRAVDYKILELNRAYENQTGRTRKDVIGRPMRERAPHMDPMWLREFARVVDTGQPVRFEHLIPRMGRWFHVRAFARGGDRFGILFDDITIQKQAEEEQKRAHGDEVRLREAANQANRAKDEFVALLGHELRNPLTPILATLDLMRLQGKKVFVKERALIERQARHLARLVDDLLDVTRIARGKVKLERQPIEFGRLIARAIETVSPVLEEKGHRLTTAIDPGLVVEVDVDRLVQVVANLLANAAKYTHPKGGIEVSAHGADDGVVFEVRDNGGGIPSDLLPHVFDLFRQGPQASDRAQGGLGLGLSIVRNIVELHGGRVSAASDGPRKGSTFTVWLPRAEVRRPAPEKPVRRRRAARERANGRRILVVDDNRDSTEVLALLLSQRGYEVEVAHDAVAGLKGALAFRPSVALLDIGLPEMDGYELARRLKAKPALRNVRLIAVTGYGQPSDREKALGAGFFEHVTKPFEFERLAELIETGDGEMAARPATAPRAAARRAPPGGGRAPASKRNRSRRR